MDIREQEFKLMREALDLVRQMEGKPLNEAKCILRKAAAFLDQTQVVDSTSERFLKVIRDEVDPENLLQVSWLPR
jgi:hypothetical protein